MKKIVLMPFAALMVFTLASCSIQKRVYRDGYHIEWNSAKNNVKQNDQLTSPEKSVAKASENKDAAADQLKDQTAVVPETSVVPDNSVTASGNTPSVNSDKREPAKKKGSALSKIIKDDSPEDLEAIRSGSKAAAFKSGFKKGLKLMMPDAESHTLHLAIASFVLGIISLFAYYGAFVLGLLAVIFGIIAINKIKNSGGAYRGNTFAWLGLIFGIIAIVVTTIYLKVY